MTDKPFVFISYAQFDDVYEGGALRRFRDELSRTLQFVSGGKIAVFQESADVAIGERIEERIKQSLNEAMVLVPLLTPSFFNDATCKSVLTRFLERERQLGRNDLVLAVYYQKVPGLDNPQTIDDPLLHDIAQRRWLDWLPLRGKAFSDPAVRQELERLARRIIAIVRELQTATPPAPPTSTGTSPSSIPTSSPQEQPMRKLSLSEITRLVDLLLACPVMEDRNTRNDVLAFLQDHVRTAIPRRDQARADVFTIVQTCNRYPGALNDLVAGIRMFNGSMSCMQEIDRFLAQLTR